MTSAQWLDHKSADVLAFVARRIYAERIGLVFAVRQLDDQREVLKGLPEHRLGGLPQDAAQELSSSEGGPLHGQAGERILAGARGNPLAVIEMTGELTSDPRGR